MPFVVQKTSQCPVSKPWGVLTETAHGSGKTRGTPHGCFPSKEAARAQQKALYKNVPEASNSETGHREVPRMSTTTPPAPLATHTHDWRAQRAKTLSVDERRRSERRQVNVPLELREEIRQTDSSTGETAGIRTLRSYASLFNTPYNIGSSNYRYEETVKPGAFKRSLGRDPDIVFRYDHAGPPLARSSSGTLRLGEDERGLWYEADLNTADPDVQALLPKIERKDLTESSFAFRCVKDTWNDDFSTRSLDECELDRGDVSVVTFGASRATGRHMILRSEELAEIQEDGFERFLEAWTEWRDYTLLSPEDRAGKVISSQSMETLRKVLNLFATADDAVDEGQALLSDLMGVPNPNEDGDLTSSEQLDHVGRDEDWAAIEAALVERAAGRDGDRLRTPAHLLDSTLVDLGHLHRHVERLGAPEVQRDLESVGFNAEHAMRHVTSAQDHLTRLGSHLEEHASDPEVFRDERQQLTAMRAEIESERAAKTKQCPMCQGTGKAKGGQCPMCHGSGEVPVGKSGRAEMKDFWEAIRAMAKEKGWVLRDRDGEMYLEEASEEDREAPSPEDSAVMEALVKAKDAIHDAVLAQKSDPDNDYYDAEVWAHIEDAKNAIEEAIIDQANDQVGETPRSAEDESEVREDESEQSIEESTGEKCSACEGTGETRDEANEPVPCAECEGRGYQEYWETEEYRRTFSTAEREKLAKSGTAMSDGSYPISSTADLRNAIQAFGRAKNPEAVKAHIKRRARALGATSLLPEDWRKEQPVLTSSNDDELKFEFDVLSRLHN